MEKLVIIGNGFDLTIGLKSRYEDFYNRKNKKNISLWEMMIEDQKNNSKENWSDIERFIEEKLSSEDGLEKEFRKYIDKLKNENGESRYSKDKNILEILDLELKNFEEDFRKYLLKEWRNFKTYSRYSRDLFSYLVKDDDLNKVSVLNFNYTRPDFVGPNLDKVNPNNIVNIHGTLSNKIVIGTDLKIISSTRRQQYTNFTKPFKILNNYINNNRVSILKNKKYGELIFYGHSLGDTDFSYFKSIFDSLNLYSGDIILKFFVPIYDENKEKIIDEFNHNVLRLLNRYSADLINVKDDDISLFTKLLLEGRLEIVPVETFLNNKKQQKAQKILDYYHSLYSTLCEEINYQSTSSYERAFDLKHFLKEKGELRKYLELITIEKELCKLNQGRYKNRKLKMLEEEQKNTLSQLVDFDEEKYIRDVFKNLENDNGDTTDK